MNLTGKKTVLFMAVLLLISFFTGCSGKGKDEQKEVYEDMKKAFAPYFTATILSNNVSAESIYDLEARIDAYTILDPADIDNANELLYSKKVITAKDKQKLTFYFNKAKNLIERYPLERQSSFPYCAILFGSMSSCFKHRASRMLNYTRSTTSYTIF